MKYNPNDNFSFLDMGGEYIDFFLELKKNFKNVKYYIFNLEKITNDFSKLKFDYKIILVIFKYLQKKLNINFEIL